MNTENKKSKLTESGAALIGDLMEKYGVSESDMLGAIDRIVSKPAKAGRASPSGSGKAAGKEAKPSRDGKFIRYLIALAPADAATDPKKLNEYIGAAGSIGSGYDPESDYRKLGGAFDYDSAHWFPAGASMASFLKECSEQFGKTDIEAIGTWIDIAGKKAADDVAKRELRNAFYGNITYEPKGEGVIAHKEGSNGGHQYASNSLIEDILGSAKARFVGLDELESSGLPIGGGGDSMAVLMKGSFEPAIAGLWPFEAARPTVSGCFPAPHPGDPLPKQVKGLLPPPGMTAKSIRDGLNAFNAANAGGYLRPAAGSVFGDGVPDICRSSRYSDPSAACDASAALRNERPYPLLKLEDEVITKFSDRLIADADCAEIAAFYNRRYAEARKKVVVAIFERTAYDG